MLRQLTIAPIAVASVGFAVPDVASARGGFADGCGFHRHHGCGPGFATGVGAGLQIGN
jgi:hypothetical protein